MSALLAVALVVGYVIGRWRPAHRASDWAHWQVVGSRPAGRGPRWWAVWTVLSAENIGWLIAHPVQGWHAWQHRNDPPPPRSPAPKIDPNWAANRRARHGQPHPNQQPRKDRTR